MPRYSCRPGKLAGHGGTPYVSRCKQPLCLKPFSEIPHCCLLFWQVLAEQLKMDPTVFSRFKTTYACGAGTTTERITWIEPLSHGLRHPNALCNRGADVMDRNYLLLVDHVDYAARHCANRACQAIYFDLGATTLQPTAQEAGQGWFFDAYRRQGVTFDRFLLWEAITQSPASVYQHVPKEDMHKYQVSCMQMKS